MKLKNVLLSLTVLCTITLAETPAELNARTMIGMESGLNNIQKGFLYNNLDLVKYGADQIIKENTVYHNRDVIKSILPKGKQQMENIALITSNRIDNSITELKTYIELKDVRKAQDAFVNVVKACTDCHNIIRGW